MMRVNVSNADEAEAVMIALYGARCSEYVKQQKYNEATGRAA